MSIAWSRPTSIDEAVDELDDDGAFLGGGVSLVLLMNLGIFHPSRFVSLSAVAELRGIALDDGALDIGAMSTHAELAADPLLRAHHPAAADMFAAIGNVRVRSWGTVGGNLVHADPAQDPPVMLTALGATARIVGPAGQRELAVEDLADGPLSSVLEPNEILTRISIPEPPPGSRSAYVKFLPGTADDYATVSAAAHIERDGTGRITAARLAAGSVGPTVVPLPDAAAVLVGQHPEPDVLAALRQAVEEQVSPQSDRRGSADYKRAMAGVTAERAVLRCFDEGGNA